ncbi:cytochrome c [Sphingomonas sp. LB2R24]|uniref:c-type cytochrome n=1 Tax=Sphingomonas sorbitolis TaxID=3096165 RepID=UPI002FC6BB65
MSIVSRLRRWKPYLLPAILLGIAGAILALAIAWRPAIAPIHAPDRGSFAPQLVALGASLAKIGDCAVCHTAERGRPLAGGRGLPTPFGMLYSTNLTPDEDTGIGKWSEAAFRRAMVDGVSRDGRHLYPALPYEHFTHVADEDVRAIYAFLMTRRPVRQVPPANRLIPPLGFRPLLAGWKMLFLKKGAFQSDPARSDVLNRGAYLAEGLGHCGGCHTPRNLMGAEQSSRAYAGGVAEGWRAPALDKTNPAAGSWTTEALYTYLRTGISPDHGVAAGSMGPVVESLSEADDKDVRAIAAYIASGMQGGSSTRWAPVDHSVEAAREFPKGAQLFAGACAACHGSGAPMASQGRPQLGLATSMRDQDPQSAIQAVLVGVNPPVAGRGPKMPGYVDSLTDEQIAQLLSYGRRRFTDLPVWDGLQKKVVKARKEAVEP